MNELLSYLLTVGFVLIVASVAVASAILIYSVIGRLLKELL